MTLRERVAEKRRTQMQKIKKAAACAAVASIGLLVLGAYSGDQKLVETTYTVQDGDTFWGISEEFLQKNTGGRRYIMEFQEGIKELNPWVMDTGCQLQPGDVLKINYWVKKDGGDSDGE